MPSPRRIAAAVLVGVAATVAAGCGGDDDDKSYTLTVQTPSKGG